MCRDGFALSDAIAEVVSAESSNGGEEGVGVTVR